MSLSQDKWEKTNLLLNAQESLKREDDIFIYLDLSNTFADSKGCFEI